MKERIQRIFSGRNGADQLNRFLSIASVVLLLVGMFTYSFLSSLGIALYVYMVFRMFSRNLYKRSEENSAYLQLRGQIQQWFLGKKQRFEQRKTHCFFKCPSCKKTVRVPKGKGKINITCPSCRTQFIKKS